MHYGNTFYIDQPVKRLWYTFSVLPAIDHWNSLWQVAKDNPVSVPNEVYRLLRADLASDPIVIVGTDLACDTEVTAQAWVPMAVDNEVKHMLSEGKEPGFIRQTIINVDQAIRDITRLRAALTVNAGLYYAHDVNVITDAEWDAMALRLVTLQQQYACVLPMVGYFDTDFVDFDGSTGFHLPYRSTPFTEIIARVLDYTKP